MTTTSRDIAGLDEGLVNVMPRRFDELEARVGGSLLHAGDEAWDDAVLVWNGMVARIPAFVLNQNISPRA